MLDALLHLIIVASMVITPVVGSTIAGQSCLVHLARFLLADYSPLMLERLCFSMSLWNAMFWIQYAVIGITPLKLRLLSPKLNVQQALVYMLPLLASRPYDKLAAAGPLTPLVAIMAISWWYSSIPDSHEIKLGPINVTLLLVLVVPVLVTPIIETAILSQFGPFATAA